MNKFLKEKGIAILLLSVIFTFSSLFWTTDVVETQAGMSSIDLGWPKHFVNQNHSQKDPPEWWFPNNIGFGLPQEYSTSIYFLPFVFSTAINFLIIFGFIFVVLKFNPNLHLLRKIISVKYIVSAVGLAFLLLVSLLIFDNSKRISQMDVGVPPPEAMLPTPSPSQDMEIVIAPRLRPSYVLNGVDLIGIIERIECQNNNLNLCNNTDNISHNFFDETLGVAVKEWMWNEEGYFISETEKSETNIYVAALYSKNDKRQSSDPFNQSTFIYKFDFNNNQVYTQSQFDGSFNNVGTINDKL